MIRQYGAQRFTLACPSAVAEKRVGTIAVGTILYIQDGVVPLRGLSRPAVCREPWIVEAWLPRDYSKWHPDLKQFRTVRISGGHLAQVRSLRDRRRTKQVADWILLECIDAGLERQAYSCGESFIRNGNHISRPSRNSITRLTTLLSKTV
ncbi:MAG TPA: hypothetical protein VJS37_13635 [Terriglobales bacterium]|nr:hypothetical protein [Terriglobales bacterium]